MKQTIRFSTFETNSSSTHSCVICTAEQFKDWEDGKTLTDWGGKTFYLREEIEKEYESDPDKDSYADFDDWCYDNEYYTQDAWVGDLETDWVEKDINGQKIVVFCKFGYDN